MEGESPTKTPYVSKFKEASLNSTSSIHPPPSVFYKELRIQGQHLDELIEKYNEEAAAPPTNRNIATATAPTQSTPSTPVPESAFGRFSRALRDAFHWDRSVLGKRKADTASAHDNGSGYAGGKGDPLKQARVALQEAQEQGLLPKPQVFVRPQAKARRPQVSQQSSDETPDPASQAHTIRKSQSKKDLYKQQKLSKRVSNLEEKLQKAKRELSAHLSDAPPVPALPRITNDAQTPRGRATPFSEYSLSNNISTISLPAAKRSKTTLQTAGTPSENTTPDAEAAQAPFTADEADPRKLVRRTSRRNLTKKRKVQEDDYRPSTTDTELESDLEPFQKAPRKVKKARRGKLAKKASIITKEEVVTVVPDNIEVPPVPSLPSGIDGNRAQVSDDGFGGYGNEIF